VQPHNATTAEITRMAVRADLRGQGIEHLRQEMQVRGYHLLLVATQAPSYDDGGPPEDGYAATRAFYHKVGFLDAREVPLYWGVGSDPALLLVMSL
jgi:GNAT superfamily N-acetyltransferase